MSMITITIRDVPGANHCMMHVASDDEEFIELKGKPFHYMTAAQQLLVTFNKSIDELVDMLKIDKEALVRNNESYIPDIRNIVH